MSNIERQAARTPRQRPLLQEYVQVLVLSALLALFARTFLVQAFETPSASMEPNLLIGDHVIVNKMVFAPTRSELEHVLLPMRRVRRGDVVVFRMSDEPERDLVKRCVATATDRVALVDKQLRVDGRPVVEAYVKHEDQNVYPDSRFLHPTLRQRDNMRPRSVPPHHLFCLGDNRDVSHDSRYLGPVREGLVRGRPLFVYWSSAPGEGSDAGSGELRWRRLLQMIR